MAETEWNKLGAYLKETQILGSIQSTLYWDQNTGMPKKGASWRSEQLTYIAKKLHKRNSSEEFSDLIKSAEDEFVSSLETLSSQEIIQSKKKNLELLTKEFNRQNNLDPKLVESLAKAKSKGYESWQEAKYKSDFKIFLPYFDDLIKLRIEEANQISEKYTNWETLAQPFEPEITLEWLNNIFMPLKEIIPSLLSDLKKGEKYHWDLSPKSQQNLCSKLLDEFGRDKDIVVVAKSPHPFSITLGPNDYRITTRIVEGEPFSSFLATAHEWGHSIYEQGLPSQSHQWFAWPLGQATSMGVHESQSLFWENRIVKSKSFSKRFFRHFVSEGCSLNNHSELWKSINHLQAGLNRVEADELSYGLHILIRTELEIDLIEGDLNAKDIPSEWNKRYEELLGIKPSNDAEGCLQDVHWSEGAFGYFPSYLLGHIISAQISSKMEKEIGLIDNLVEDGEYEKIIFWLKNNIHKYGRSLNSMELVRNVTGEELTSSYFVNHLKSKLKDFC
ncbi:Carboxypeptidase Taq (M32) metallopeptidase [Prochlorococcus marinus str. MIT 9515]|uniref:Metal-dependent carboxypeptidase n=1 Tax=Prochlorococcus marinus (strain MIT 9515) TaxID=167542 RepID=A2BVF5_PROM5|nr:carboxypeptidase M32 [Prochlorococcus marinus]ABM71766.1 Carboxypeptidase Taq (M32) metallopeptidase [Prochlorococcus marinus str. MIT 9515]